MPRLQGLQNCSSVALAAQGSPALYRTDLLELAAHAIRATAGHSRHKPDQPESARSLWGELGHALTLSGLRGLALELLTKSCALRVGSPMMAAFMDSAGGRLLVLLVSSRTA